MKNQRLIGFTCNLVALLALDLISALAGHRPALTVMDMVTVAFISAWIFEARTA